MCNTETQFSRLAQRGLLLSCLILAPCVWAFGLMISEQQINGMLALSFPYETKMASNQITLSDPKPQFYEASQEIGVELNVALKDLVSGKVAKAKTLIRGGVRFDNKQQQLQLVKPKIVSLDWSDKSLAANQDWVDQVKKLVGQDLPVIVLLDVKQITGNAFAPTLSDVKIRAQGLELIF